MMIAARILLSMVMKSDWLRRRYALQNAWIVIAASIARTVPSMYGVMCMPEQHRQQDINVRMSWVGA